MPPRTDIPPQALESWDSLIARIQSSARFESLVVDLIEATPLPSGKRRQKCRILEWFKPDGVLPSAPFALLILTSAIDMGILTVAEVFPTTTATDERKNTTTTTADA